MLGQGLRRIRAKKDKGLGGQGPRRTRAQEDKGLGGQGLRKTRAHLPMTKVNMATRRMEMRVAIQTSIPNGSRNMRRPGGAFLGFM